MPKGKYKGQKFTRLVSTNIPASPNKTYPNIPEMTLPISNPAIIAATMSLIILSAVPIFGFIVHVFKVINKIHDKVGGWGKDFQ
jgi:hypothetical protein